MSLKQRIKSLFHQDAHPSHIAFGGAIGTLIGILPTPGIGILLAVLVLLILPKTNKFALFAALLFWNPLILIPVYMFSIKLGNYIIGGAPIITNNLSLVDQIFHYTRLYLIGNTIIAVTASIMVYVMTYFIAKAIKCN